MVSLNLLAATPGRVAEHLAPLDLPAYRLRQIHRWVWEKLEADIQAFSDLPAALRAKLAEVCRVRPPEVVKTQKSGDGKTTKLLLRLTDGAHVECVLMLHPRRRPTFCLSSQTGCAQGCAFCATGRLGKGRNLNAFEMVQQVWCLRRLARDDLGKDLPGHNVVFMGMGEPLDNLTCVTDAINVLTSTDCFGISSRAVTVSTVGIPKAIRSLARADLGVSLAVSLNAPNDKIRHRIMPGQRRRTIEQILASATYFFEKTRRRVTIEYVLIDGVNDGGSHLRELAERLKSLPLQVNLIPCNPSTSAEFKPPPQERCEAAVKILTRKGIRATLRHSQGGDIQAACGQLAPRKPPPTAKARAKWAKARPKPKPKSRRKPGKAGSRGRPRKRGSGRSRPRKE